MSHMFSDPVIRAMKIYLQFSRCPVIWTYQHHPQRKSMSLRQEFLSFFSVKL